MDLLLSRRLRSRPVTPYVQVWRAAKWWAAAWVCAAFPLLFILDARFDAPMSPILPGILALAAWIVVVPLLMAEWGMRRLARHKPDERSQLAGRRLLRARLATVAALVWLCTWWGAGL